MYYRFNLLDVFFTKCFYTFAENNIFRHSHFDCGNSALGLTEPLFLGKGCHCKSCTSFGSVNAYTDNTFV